MFQKFQLLPHREHCVSTVRTENADVVLERKMEILKYINNLYFQNSKFLK